MINILISGAGGDVCDGVLKSLIISGKKFNIYIVGSFDNKLQLYFPFKILKSPKVAQKKKYLFFLKNTIAKYSIDIFIPCIDEEIELISKYKKRLKCKVLVDNYNFVKNFNDKFLTYKFFLKNNIITPETSICSKKNLSYFKFPFVIKKRNDSGSKNFKIINSRKDLTKIAIKKNDFIVQEYISGKDYTAGIYKVHKKIKILLFERNLINGRTQFAKKVLSDSMNKQIVDIFIKLNLNFCNMQFKFKNNQVSVYEINPRLSGTIGLQSNFFNFPYFFIKKNFHTKKIIKNNSKNISAIRVNDFLFI
jgi:carbamoyl-phosphate synthase large subunit